MKIDFSKVICEEIVNDEYPTQVFYYWNVDSDTIREFINYYDLLNGSIDEKFDVTKQLSASFCLVVWEDGDYKLELIVNDEDGNRIWVEVCRQFYWATEWIELIPDYEKLQIRTMEEV